MQKYAFGGGTFRLGSTVCLEMLIAATLLVSPALVVPPARLVVVGPGSREVQLLVSKLAAAAGHGVSLVARDADIRPFNTLMYGEQQPEVENAPRYATQNTQIGMALGSAEGLVLCLAGSPVPPSTSGFATMLPYASRLKRVVLLSAIGGSIGNTGGLGEGDAIKRCEEEIFELAAGAGVEVSTARVGVLKGGAAAGENEAGFGLNRVAYYASLTSGGYPTPASQTAAKYDKETLGVAVLKGGAIPARSVVVRAQTRTSAAPCADEVSRINAACALLALLRREGPPLEVSLSSAEGATPPSDAEWDALLATVA